MADNTVIHPKCQDLEYLLDLYCLKGRPQNRDAGREVQVLVNHGYAVGFCPKRLQPLWAAYRVARADQDVDFDRPHLYYDDMRLEKAVRVGPETFGLPYHVGHMVPNEAINRQFGRLAQMETFLMSNMSPQLGTLNTGVWNTLERAILDIPDTDDKDHMWVIVGPIFGDDPEFIERANGARVPIPEAYYCITADPWRWPWDENVDIVAYRFPQTAPSGTSPSAYEVEVDVIEAATNLRFFPGWDVVAPPGGDALGPLGAAAPTTGGRRYEKNKQRHRLARQFEA